MIQLLFDNSVLRAIAWTMVHSLWIGAVFAAAAWTVLRFGISQAQAALRYNTLCVLLYAFTGCIVAAAVIEFSGIAISPAKQEADANAFSLPEANLYIEGASPFHPLGMVDRYAAFFASVWFLAFLYKIVRFIAGLLSIRRLRLAGSEAAPSVWQEKVRQIATRLGIRKTILLLQSDKIGMPLTVGYFRPVVILPAGLFFQLPLDQVETIFWHELSHIRRKDYMVNLIHCAVEAVFCFNPAVVWLLSLIREERENCCDDIVLAHGSQKTVYMKALLSFESAAATSCGPLAMGLEGSQLARRLKRMAGIKAAYFNRLESAGILAGIALLVIVLVAGTMATTPSPSPAHGAAPKVVMPGQTPPLSQPEMSILSARSAPADPPQKARSVTSNQVKVTVPVVTATHFNNDAERVRGLLEALVRLGVVSDRASVKWFALTDRQLIVNAVPQPEALHQELKERFNVLPDYGLFYGPVEIVGKGFFVDEQELAAL